MSSQILRATETGWSRLRKHFSISFRTPRSPETAALALLGKCSSPERTVWLLAELLLPRNDDLKIASNGEVVLSGQFLRRAHVEMRKRSLAGVAVLHSHPFADSHVDFSLYDNHEEPLLIANLREINPDTNVVSIVFGKQCQRGRVWQSVGPPSPLTEIHLIGERIQILNALGEPPLPPPKPGAVFDRALPITGTGALALLSRLHFVVVGASGTGTVVCQLLLRAGARHITVIDDDFVDYPNVIRMLHANIKDAAAKTPKVRVVERAVKDSGMECTINCVEGTILDKSVLALLRSGDVIIECVDAATPRLLSSQFSYQYLLPLIDVGSEIGADKEGIISVDARATYVSPGRSCLQCNGIITPRQLHFEGLSWAERQRVEKLGYSDDLALRQPAVMDLNMQASGLGTLILRHLLQPFMIQPLPASITSGFVSFAMKAPTVAKAADANCVICQRNPSFGYGDQGPQLGFDKEVVNFLKGPK